MERGCERQVPVRATAGACAPASSPSGAIAAMYRSIAASTAARSCVASRSSRRPRVTATPRRASARASASSRPCATAIRVSGSTQRSTMPSRTGRAWGWPLERLRVDLEEQALVRPERRVRDVVPRAAHDLGRRRVLVEQHRRDRRALLGLDRADDLDQQALARPEVVDEHPVAGAEGGGEATEAEVADAVLGDVVHRAREQTLAGGRPVARLTRAARHPRGS